nr:acyltransferase [Chthoniobacterales bacterium]
GPHSPFATLLYPFYHFGLYGVQIFWGISGFIFYWKYAAALTARTVEPARFFWLRFSRLYPLHFVTLLFVAAIQPIYFGLAGHTFVFGEYGPERFLLQLFLADQWGGSHAMSFNGPIWSVSAEVFVYAAFFLLLRAFGRSPLIIFGAVAGGLWSMWSGAISPALICGSYFFAGGAAAEWLGSDRATKRPVETRLIAGFMTGAGAIVAIFALIAHPSGPSDHAISTWLLVVIPPSLLLAAQDWRPLERWQRPIQAAGNLTYSTYLIHFPMQLALVTFCVAAGVDPPVSAGWFLLAYLAASIVIGRVVFLGFEAPAQRMIRAATLTRRSGPVTA